MFTDPAFWKAAGERALSTFAQALLAYLLTSQVGVFHLDWLAGLELALGATVLSLLKSIVAANLGSNAGPSLANEKVVGLSRAA
jgi:r1t holin